MTGQRNFAYSFIEYLLTIFIVNFLYTKSTPSKAQEKRGVSYSLFVNTTNVLFLH